MLPKLATTADNIELEASLYGGAVTVQRGDFGGRSHAYRWAEKGLFIPGATSILQVIDKPALVQWAATQAVNHVEASYRDGLSKEEFAAILKEAKSKHIRIKDESAQVGSNVHALAQALFEGKPFAIPDDLPTQKAIKGIQDWTEANDVRPIDVERIVFSRNAFYAGTFDLLCLLNGKLTLLDLKTSNYVYNEHKIQLGGYKFAWEEEHQGEYIDQLVILHLNKKTGAVKPYLFDDPQQMQLFEDTFLRAKSLKDNIKLMEAV